MNSIQFHQNFSFFSIFDMKFIVFALTAAFCCCIEVASGKPKPSSPFQLTTHFVFKSAKASKATRKTGDTLKFVQVLTAFGGFTTLLPMSLTTLKDLW
jgi:hypothetical protein